jgi:hypothetical protein
MARNLIAAFLATTGIGLLCWAAIDWVAYTQFTLSLIWK